MVPKRLATTIPLMAAIRALANCEFTTQLPPSALVCACAVNFRWSNRVGAMSSAWRGEMSENWHLVVPPVPYFFATR